jgi:hypothetical protein
MRLNLTIDRYHNFLQPDWQWPAGKKRREKTVKHRSFYEWARRFVADENARTGRVPGDAEFCRAAVRFLDFCAAKL